ncbi:MAG: group II intron reverse transcriptase domain-containing protein [Rhodocyclaceae bacterium]|nr:group II intron reverse transcriptase domain-containing protein [Rhodocyclaceae bacterium]
MKRLRIELDQIAAWDNLLLATWKAARGKRDRPEVSNFLAALDANLARLAQGIMDQTVPSGSYRAFAIRDPKPRFIHAAPFSDRVLHHAILNLTERAFDSAQVDDSYACRTGRGAHRAVLRVQQHLRRYAWYVQVDVAGYFNSIDHAILKGLLAQRFKGMQFLQLLARIIGTYACAPGKGLPIGSLTSQYFANHYLVAADRLLLARPDVRALVRYMDDSVFWCDDRASALQALADLREHLSQHRQLQLKPAVQINRSAHGLTFCGYRVKPATVRLTVRKARRYGQGRRLWEGAYAAGEINACQLQAGYAAVLAPALHADSVTWRRRDLQLHPPGVENEHG